VFLHRGGSTIRRQHQHRNSILKPGRNVWRIERARRAAVLIDAAATFRAVREAMTRAEHSIFILGWDIHSRTRLVGESGRADDGLPDTLVEFLSALVAQKPDLVVHLLLWDFSVLYALEREFLPHLSLNWSTPDQVRFCLDKRAPLGCSQHQKIVVVDDAVAFSGGLDLTVRRWDTPEHRLQNPLRVDHAGEPYRPFHDVQAVVDGDAARALSELARERWRQAACAEPPASRPGGDPWPQSVTPDFQDVDIGIARTQPCYEGNKDIREVEKLFHDSIDAAENAIYIENQFLTVRPIAERIARRMKRKRKLETVAVAPSTHSSWIESQTMRNGRIRFRNAIRDAGVADRFRLVYPEVADGDEKTDTMIHSKVTVIDDRLLRIGSANLNHRSMGADTECDLVIEAKDEKHRAAIRRIRDTLLGEHCGSSAQDVAELLEDTGSFVAITDMLCNNGHCLRAIDDGKLDPNAAQEDIVEELADPYRPLNGQSLLQKARARVAAMVDTRVAVFAGVACFAALLAFAWAWTPLAEYARIETVRGIAAGFSEHPWAAPALVLGAFLVGGLIAFPVTIMIAATAAVFGPVCGFAYATLGAMASALSTYGLGIWLGRDSLRHVLRGRSARVLDRIRRQGVLAVAATRLLPVAPFTVVNLAAGAAEIRLFDFTVGTLLGLAPGLVLLSALGSQAVRVLTQPSAPEMAALAGIIALWLAASFGLQRLVTKFGRSA
jgi:phosphatidylserine/phosphatidylglycerophosphate/cardiolipin synthase-like enzyme/uncharacterized membrane protein YdjX (TVP38/TMEM64 family)